MFMPSDEAVLSLFLPAAYVDVFLLFVERANIYIQGFPL